LELERICERCSAIGRISLMGRLHLPNAVHGSIFSHAAHPEN
jgi:hypothetical protein